MAAAEAPLALLRRLQDLGDHDPPRRRVPQRESDRAGADPHAGRRRVIDTRQARTAARRPQQRVDEQDAHPPGKHPRHRHRARAGPEQPGARQATAARGSSTDSAVPRSRRAHRVAGDPRRARSLSAVRSADRSAAADRRDGQVGPTSGGGVRAAMAIGRHGPSAARDRTRQDSRRCPRGRPQPRSDRGVECVERRAQTASVDEFVFATASGRPRDKDGVRERVRAPVVHRAYQIRPERASLQLRRSRRARCAARTSA